MNNYQNSYFCLFANCIPVKGAKRSIVCDLQNGFYVFIRNTDLDILTELENCQINELKNADNFAEVCSLVNQLIENGLGGLCEDPSRFPKIGDQISLPYQIYDCILELSDINFQYCEKILNSLTEFGCQTLELRSYQKTDTGKLKNLLSMLSRTRIRNVEICVKFATEVDVGTYTNILEKFPIVESVVLHSAPRDSETIIGVSKLIETSELIDSSRCCGNISPKNFVVNQEFFFHAKKWNSCLYKKVSIREDGAIMNCPSMKEIFGNIVNDNLNNIVEASSFKTLWGVSKDKIDVCKECEFRYICSDCRAFLNDPKSKPLKCTYNPNTMMYA